MLSLTTAAAMLERPVRAADLAGLASLVGCDAAALPLDRTTLAALGLGDLISSASIAAGPGALRALLIECPDDVALRDRVSAIAARLARSAGHLLWLVIALAPGGRELVIATWIADRSRPRVAALTVDRGRVMPSDAETLCALAAARGDVDTLTHARWLEVLGREALTGRFYRALERVVDELAHRATGRGEPDVRREVALLYVSRLIFLSFLEAKGWLDRDRAFLARGFEECVAGAGRYHSRVLLPLFFGTLNTPVARRAPAARRFGRVPFLNGGLFARTPAERRAPGLSFDDETLGVVYGDLLGRYRFTAREDSAEWSDAAIDPEMMGRAFESLMASRERRASGAYYTPASLVARVTRSALVDALSCADVSEAQVEAALDGVHPAEAQSRRLLERALRITLLDPACGSGAFLVHSLETIAGLAARLGDPRSTESLRRQVLTHGIFGIDASPIAVWLCQLRLWLSVVIESGHDDPLAAPPLPNLDRNIRVGDTLAGPAFGPERVAPHGAPAASRVVALRTRYTRATGGRKRGLERALAQAERAHAIAVLDREVAVLQSRREELLAACRGRDLFGGRRGATSGERAALAALRDRVRRLRTTRRGIVQGAALPFSFPTHLPDIAERGGFDVIVGNPPWVRLHRIPAEARGSLRERFEVFRLAGWMRGMRAAHAGAGFAAQVDLAALFVERSLALLRDGAPFSLLLPVKLWHSLAGSGVRALLTRAATVTRIEDWSASAAAFDAAVYPSLLMARRGRGAEDRCVSVAVHRQQRELWWTSEAPALRLDDDPASPWLFLPPPVRAAFDHLALRGVPLGDGPLGRPTLGIKCGCNEAYVVDRVGSAAGIATVRSGRRTGRVESRLLRPLLRGETLRPWRAVPSHEHVLWTHDESGQPLRTLPPLGLRWLTPHRARLSRRTDARRGQRWWALFRLHGANASRPRVVWADFGRSPRALVLSAGDPTVPLNSCYVLSTGAEEDAHALAALLNGPLCAAWLNAIAEPARGGYHRYLAWTVALLPIPADWARARKLLAPIGVRASHGDAPPEDELLDAALRAYRVRRADVEPLLAWSA